MIVLQQMYKDTFKILCQRQKSLIKTSCHYILLRESSELYDCKEEDDFSDKSS